MCAGTELADLARLRLHIRLLVTLLCCISIAAYIISQLWLFTQQAQEEVHLVEASGELRTLCISALFYARSSVLAAVDNHTELVEDLEHQAAALAERLQLQHLDNYENIKRAAMKEAYVRKNITTMVPVGRHWIEQTLSFWEMGNEIARRMRRASQMSVEDLISIDYDTANISEAKLGMVYLSENVFRAALPAFDEMTSQYENDMANLATTTNVVVSLSTGLHCLVLIFIAIVAIRGNATTIQVLNTYTCTHTHTHTHTSIHAYTHV
jgi:hypothetical protein